jgi:hypothetical protein
MMLDKKTLADLQTATGCATRREAAEYFLKVAEDFQPGITKGLKPRPESPSPPTTDDDDGEIDDYPESRKLAAIIPKADLAGTRR